jgi:hypothetical protein
VPVSFTKTLCIITCLFFLAIPTQSASIFFTGFVEINLEKDTFKAGESLKGYFRAGNSDSAGFYDSEIIAEIASGPKGSISYPSQLSDKGNIFLEKKFPISLLPNQEKKVPFEIPLPKDIKEGTYTILAYFKTKRSPITGIPHIFLNPVEKEFKVQGTGSFPYATITRTKTEFNGDTGPIGTWVKPEQNIEGKIFIKNLSNQKLQNLVLWTGLCDWDDTACEKFLTETKTSLELEPNEEKQANLTLKAPTMPGAYAIRIELMDKDGRTISLYRNRAIVEGPTAKIKKMAFYGDELKPNKPVKIYALIGSSPDHYTKPDFYDFNVSIWIEKDGKKIFVGKQQIPVLKFSEIEKEINANFTPDLAYQKFMVCSAIEKDNTIYDRYCFEVFPIEADYNGKKGEIMLETLFSEPSELKIKACGFAPNGNEEDINLSISIVEAENSIEKYYESFDSGTCIEKYYPIERKKYLLLVNDFKNNKQISKEIDLTIEKPKSCNELGGVLCESNAKCDGDKISNASEQGICCKGTCEEKPDTTIENYKQTLDFQLEVIILAGIIVVLLALIALSARRYKNETP